MSRLLRPWWRRSPGADARAAAPAASPLTVALYGAGMIARAHGSAAQLAGMRVVAVASRTDQRARALADELATEVCTIDDLLAGAVAADVVVVATPPACHASEAVALLDRGYAVLVEKPLCRTLAEADALVEAAARHPNHLWYGENLVYAPVVQQLLARAGDLGTLTHLEVRALQAAPTWGGYTTDDWGGGALFDLGVHPLAIALLCANAAGAGAPTAVSATMRGGVGHGSDEWSEVRVHYPTGLVARVEASWLAGPTAVCDAQIASATGVVRAEIIPDPALEHNGEAIRLMPDDCSDSPLVRLGLVGQFATLENEHTSRTVPTMGAAFGRFVLDVVCAAYRSAGRASDPESLPFTGPRTRTPLDLWRRG